MPNYWSYIAASYQSAVDAFVLAVLNPQSLVLSLFVAIVVAFIAGATLYHVGVKRGYKRMEEHFRKLPRDFGLVWPDHPNYEAYAQHAPTTKPVWGQQTPTARRIPAFQSPFQSLRMAFSTLTAPPSHLAGVRARANWNKTRNSSAPALQTHAQSHPPSSAQHTPPPFAAPGSRSIPMSSNPPPTLRRVTAPTQHPTQHPTPPPPPVAYDPERGYTPLPAYRR